MRRLILTVTGTVAGVAALLAVKTQGHPLADSAPLPTAALGGQRSALPGVTTPARTSSPPSGGSTAPARSYLGNAITTRYGVIQVKVTVKGGAITDVGFTQLTAFDGHSQRINSEAAPQLLRETLSTQSAHVDTVSGASYTSEGYRQSLQSTLDEAGVR